MLGAVLTCLRRSIGAFWAKTSMVYLLLCLSRSNINNTRLAVRCLYRSALSAPSIIPLIQNGTCFRCRYPFIPWTLLKVAWQHHASIFHRTFSIWITVTCRQELFHFVCRNSLPRILICSLAARIKSSVSSASGLCAISLEVTPCATLVFHSTRRTFFKFRWPDQLFSERLGTVYCSKRNLGMELHNSLSSLPILASSWT